VEGRTKGKRKGKGGEEELYGIMGWEKRGRGRTGKEAKRGGKGANGRKGTEGEGTDFANNNFPSFNPLASPLGAGDANGRRLHQISVTNSRMTCENE
jgi:hypothetical protein